MGEMRHNAIGGIILLIVVNKVLVIAVAATFIGYLLNARPYTHMLYVNYLIYLL